MPALRRSLKLSGMLDEPDGSPLFPRDLLFDQPVTAFAGPVLEDESPCAGTEHF